ncbi:MAG: hypothetical protein Q9183_002910 [Haloplaca sp. 2 TL-2023]
MHGLSGFTEQEVERSFRAAFKHEKVEHPNYGKEAGMDPTRWWSNVIRSTFSAISPPPAAVPQSLIVSLLQQFSSQKGYRLFDDVLPFFQELNRWRTQPGPASASGIDPMWLQVGVISNSDDRVSAILASLGINVNERTCAPSAPMKPKGPFDIDWVTLSYDAGAEKPNRSIFDAAEKTSAMASDRDTLFCHVGDNLSEDYHGALGAGWETFLLDRDDQHKDDVPGARRITSLGSLLQRLVEESK